MKNHRAKKLRIARQMKEQWLSEPVEFWEPTIFGELKIGDKFICMPEPGDNDGHGGLKGEHSVCQKIEKKRNKFGDYNNAIDLANNILCSIPNNSPVLQIE